MKADLLSVSPARMCPTEPTFAIFGKRPPLTLTLLIFTCLLSLPLFAQTRTPQRLDWPYYGNDVANTRYQNVDQINPSNVAQLKPAWVFHTGVHDKDASMETSPLVLNGVMYLTSGDDDVFAVNAGTGAQIWVYHPKDMPPLSQLPLCCARNNRGVAQGQGRLYLARLDATLVALSQQSGQQLWKTTVDDWHNGYTMTIPPQYVNGLVIVGVSGGEYFIRGHVDAYNAQTGSLVWRFYTTDPNTFAGDSYLQGGGPVWQNPSFDLGLGMPYFSVGNAGPDINGVPAPAPTSTPLAWLRSTSPLARYAGTSRNPITISGITTLRLPRCCSR